ncbi:hypothetical protein SAMN05444143_10184 [Flavobacterium succinicans]|jgi:hypothetical protein|uniref:Uncharacterized protein n=1 Tax=Flavobacterium succinicans TaxID=29536 RepID=A0A1I4QXB5_9FLAO|nr:hypothetical protein SAMN05444143_10184 [Flavobacterium succinicans]
MGKISQISFPYKTKTNHKNTRLKLTHIALKCGNILKKSTSDTFLSKN